MKEEKIECEFGSIGKVRFLDASQIKMYDCDGKEEMCKCGNPATEGIIGRHASIHRCTECMKEINA